MKLDNEYRIETDTYNVKLVFEKPFYDEQEGKMRTSSRTTFHGSLKQALKSYVGDKMKEGIENVTTEQLIKKIEQLENKIEEIEARI